MDPQLSIGLIDLAVGGPNEIFESLDPAPSGRRDLDGEVEEFIIHGAEENKASRYALIVRMPDAPLSASDEAALGESIRHHFAHRTDEEDAKIRSLVKDGKRDLAIGLAFLFVCGIAGIVAARVLPQAVGLFVDQGLLILGWVALWRPVDLFLYELRPMRVRRATLSALSKVDVRITAREEAMPASRPGTRGSTTIASAVALSKLG